MATTAEYLDKLVTQKNTLADNLVEKGVEATHDETLETLVPKVLDISGGSSTEQFGIYPVGEDSRPTGDVIVPDNVTSLYRYTFSEDNNITSVKLPESLVEFPRYAFYNCKNLLNVNIPDNTTQISESCFENCNQLTEITLPKKLKTIYTNAFKNCTNLKINVPDEIQEDLIVYGYAFSGCEGLNNESVTKIATKIAQHTSNYLFANIPNITEVTVKYVYSNDFYNCTNLKKATILKSSVNHLGSSVFSNCNNLEEVVLPDDATKINVNMFNGNTNLTKVNIPSSLIIIEQNAFSNSGINNITLPETLTTISAASFEYCNNLTSINIPNNVTLIGSYAFQNCSNLTSVSIGENTQYTLEKNAFAGTGITDEYVSDIVSHAKTIYPNIFQGCNSLINIEINVIWTEMFLNCENLKTVKVTHHSTGTGNNVFKNDTKLESVIIESETLTTIGICVFGGCTSLKTVHLPSSITTATSDSLTSTSSAYYAFYNCKSLEDIQLGQDWNMSLRLNVSNNITVDSMVAMFNSLKDLTGDTAKTLTLGETNLAKLTDEQKAIATNKNWTLA